jgi:hypothetical protein
LSEGFRRLVQPAKMCERARFTDSFDSPETPYMPSTSRLIKKYPNRRLYDTQTSAYITLADVKQLVLESEDFKVSMPRAAKT